MFGRIKEKLFLKKLEKAELDENGVLRCQNNERLIAFIYILDNKEYIYVFNQYKKYRNEIEKIIAKQRNNATHIHIADETDLGNDIRPCEETIYFI